jgi:Fe-S oxidoreductase
MRPGTSKNERFSPDAHLVLDLPGEIMTSMVVFGFAFTFVIRVKSELLWHSPVGAHLVRRAWVVEEDKKHFAPEMLVHLVIDESTKVATCLSKCGRCTDVAEKGGDDDDLFYEFRREKAKRSPKIAHAPATDEELKRGKSTGRTWRARRFINATRRVKK